MSANGIVEVADTLSDLRAAAERAADHLVGLLGRENGAAFLVPLVRTSFSTTPFSISHGRFGFLLSIDGRAPDLPRIGVQPGEECSVADLAELLGGAGFYGRAAAAGLDALGCGVGSRRGLWEFGVAGDARRLRVYLGPTAEGQIAACGAALRGAGWLPPAVGKEFRERIDRLRPWITPIALARDFGGSPHYKFYFASVPVTPRLLEYGLADDPPATRAAVNDAIAHLAAPRQSWSFTLDRDGALLDWKLELSGPGLVPDRLVGVWPVLKPFLALVDDLAAATYLVPRLACASLRVEQNLPPTPTAYFAFDEAHAA